MDNNRIEWIDGLKGLSCLLIFVHHFLLIFFPAIHYGEAVSSHLSGVDTYLSQSPLSVILNGNFLVAIFCMISGIVISLQVLQLQNQNKLSNIILKRYFRLMLPIIPMAIFVFFMLRSGGFSNLEMAQYTQSPWAAMFYTRELSLSEFIESLFIRIWFYGDDSLSTAFWMLSELFYGTFLSIALSVVSWKYKRVWVVYLFVAIFLFNNSDLQFAFAVGTALAWLKLKYPNYRNKFVGISFILIGLFLGGYPSGVIPTNIYSALNFVSYADWHMLGALCLITGISCLNIIQKILSSNLLRNLGKISYSIYILHIPVIFMISNSVFLYLSEGISYLNTVAILLFGSSVVLIIVAIVYHKLVEKNCIYVQEKIFEWIE